MDTKCRSSVSGKVTVPPMVWACFVITFGISLAHSWHYLPFVADDALISYRYSDRLLHGHGLTWNDGEFVEGYSNLLWVLLVAAGGLVEENLVRVGWALGLAANAATLMSIAWAFGRADGTRTLSIVAGMVALALSGPFAVWGVGGLETALIEALVAWALATTYRVPRGPLGRLCPALILGFLSVSRPDGILFSVSLAVAVLIRDGLSPAVARRALVLLLVPLAFMAAQVCFRFAYYEDIVPNTAYVKIAFTLDRLLLGTLYAGWGALVNLVPLLIVAIGMLSIDRQTRLQLAVFLIPACVWVVYIAIIGGDFFPAQRHWLPALVCLAFSLTRVLQTMLPDVASLRTNVLLVVASTFHFILSVVTMNTFFGVDKGHIEAFQFPFFAFSTKLKLSCIPIGQLLGKAFSTEHPLIAVNAAGCLPFESRLPALDMLGLNDRHIARHRPSDMGEGLIGHELGDGPYVLSRKPDLIEFGPSGSEEASLRGELEMVRMPEFHQKYRLVTFVAGNAVAPLWVRVEDGRLGIIRTSDRIYIPGFLLATTTGAQAELDRAGRPVTSLQHGEAVIEKVVIPVGTWQVSLETDEPGRLNLATTPTTQTMTLSPSVLRIVSDGTARSFHVTGGRGLIYSITAMRLSELGR